MTLDTLPLKAFCTTSEAAEMLSISLRTAQLWVENGQLQAWKTEGGHRRISRASVERLLAQSPRDSVKEVAGTTDTAHPAPLKVLVVEDDLYLRRLYEINLRHWAQPVNLSLAHDGYEALIHVGRDKPDLLITDLNMPGMDGFRMLYAICSMAELASIRIVIVSGLDPEEIKSRGGVPEHIRILSKPIPFDRLAAIATDVAQSR